MLCVDLGYDTYDYLPDSRVKYPFVFVGEQFKQNERNHKDSLNGKTQVTVHVWHNSPRRRGTTARMMANIEKAILTEYGHNATAVNTWMLIDSSTGSDLLHGVLEVEIKY